MRILVLGGTGMLGHKMVETLAEAHEVWKTVRASDGSARSIEGIDAHDFDAVETAVRLADPEVVVNCIGLIKQLAEAKDAIACLTINALLPHRLAKLCTAQGRRLVQISTDCVFDGRKGGYVESDLTNAEDLYGRSKAMGEVLEAPHLTLRTSIIGRELRGGASLVEWILAQSGREAKGYTRALFSGLTTRELSRVVRDVVLPRPDLCGLYHVSAAPISKHDLLRLVADAYGLDLRIQASDEVAIDRTLDSTRFWQATGYRAPAWVAMVSDMARDSASYAGLERR